MKRILGLLLITFWPPLASAQQPIDNLNNTHVRNRSGSSRERNYRRPSGG